jgi:protein involved in polysaccharide export with SLBB domain
MKVKGIVWLCIGFVLMLSCARYPTVPAFEKVDNATAASREGSSHGTDDNYVIGPDDLLHIQVWDHPDLERKLFVSTNGTFSYPFVGEVHAAGLSVEKVEQEIARRLDQGYIVNPQVTVTVDEPKVKYFYVFGEVEKPGQYEWEKGITVLQAIATAGGLTETAAVRRTKIVREHEGVQVNRKAQMTEPVLPNDTVMVPESFF